MEEKEDFAIALATLLSLDRSMIDDLKRLKIDTLAKMYKNYIQNAKDVNHKMEMLAGAMQRRKRTGQRPTINQIKQVIHNA